MTVIAMTHEIGTFGQQVASQLALRIGVDYADQQFLEQRIADRSARDKGLSACGCTSGTNFDSHLQVDGRRLARHARDEIGELAAYGHILMQGWGAASLLRDNPHIFRIRVWAPMSFRLRVMADREPTRNEGSLRRQIERSDTCLASNMQPVLGPDWQSAEFYHVVLGTHVMPVDDCVAQLERFITTASTQPGWRSRREAVRGLTDQPACQYRSLVPPTNPMCVQAAMGTMRQCHRCRTR
jgi:cytidylate kinase